MESGALGPAWLRCSLGGITYPTRSSESLGRLQYLVRWVAFVAVLCAVWALRWYVGIPDWLALTVGIVLFGFKFIRLDVPRLRSIGWSPWLVFLNVVPILNALFQLLLFGLPEKHAS